MADHDQNKISHALTQELDGRASSSKPEGA